MDDETAAACSETDSNGLFSLLKDDSTRLDMLAKHWQQQHADQLHQECAKINIRAEKLSSTLQSDPEAAFKRADTFQDLYPVLVLLQEHASELLLDNDLFEFCMDLIWLNPEALLFSNVAEQQHDEENEKRKLLFFEGVYAWINMSRGGEEQGGAACGGEEEVSEGVGIRNHIMAMVHFESKTKEYSNGTNGRSREHIYHRTFSDKQRDSELQQQLSPSAEVALRILTAMIDTEPTHDYNEKINSMTEKSADEVLDILIENLASTPDLMKEVLLLDDDTKSEVFDLSIMKHVLLKPAAYGKWMYQFAEDHPNEIIFCFQAVSELLTGNVDGLIHNHDTRASQATTRSFATYRSNERSRPPQLSILRRAASVFHIFDSNIEDAENVSAAEVLRIRRDELLEFLSNDFRILGLVVSMDSEYQQLAVSTRLIQVVANMQTTRPFNTCLTMMDLTLHMVLFLAFEVQSITFLGGNGSMAYIIAAQATQFTLFYFVTRELLQIASQPSIRDFKQDILFDIWNHIDLFAVFLILASSTQMNDGFDERVLNRADDTGSDTVPELDPKTQRIQVSATVFGTFFLFHYIRIINEEYAVLINSLGQVIVDLKWFILVILIALSTFSQLFMVTIPGTDYVALYCSDIPINENSTDYEVLKWETMKANQNFDLDCTDMYSFKYFSRRSFQMMLGDWRHEADALAQDSLIYLIFVIFSFMITVVLLNMLIAIVADAYKNANAKGPALFRMMRLNYCAEVSLMETAMMDNRRLFIVLLVSSAMFVYIMLEMKHNVFDQIDNEEDDALLYPLFSSLVFWTITVLTAFGVLRCTATQLKDFNGRVEQHRNGEIDLLEKQTVATNDLSAAEENASSGFCSRIFGCYIGFMVALCTFAGNYFIGVIEDDHERKLHRVVLPPGAKTFSIDLKEGTKLVKYT
mmetsp:Transcript_32075/g.46613  ORF Transcript_32075/g.46613 Transcript_32075/m.46613 type:complete len:922 (-) Transcript_32075:173-2938(-)|eukprot:CAMPEP_0116035818 /NCGR_PEP_ID=MMETSP0321-20121206/20660_1 /TAXON_ID=163516 /ORGANISM="Leptocylindrus danicus var. danicus, Strain B650" /LENGTH=921 /DNA_ID=CAMNT_0003512855 /DNA_START=459 /DNA_END=3224 /DNA_ORIENTATION=-